MNPPPLVSRRAVLASAACAATGMMAGIKIDPGNMSPYSKTQVGSRIYTASDPHASGGIRGVVAGAPSDVLGVLAIPQRFPNVAALDDQPDGRAAKNLRFINTELDQDVYLAMLGNDHVFVFQGLPPGRYDLFVLCANCFYEGLLLSREEHTLTEADVASIRAKINESNPFFNVKNQHRIEGQTSSHGRARVLEQEVRTRPVTLQSAEVLTHIQIRSIKLCFMESVGSARIGAHWEMKKTRELTRQEVGPPDTKGVLPGYFCRALQGIRVSSTLRDAGVIALSADEPPVPPPPALLS